MTTLYVDEGPQPAIKWSNTLMRAAIEYINDIGPDGKSSYTSAANVARNGYVEAACKVFEFELTHN